MVNGQFRSYNRHEEMKKPSDFIRICQGNYICGRRT